MYRFDRTKCISLSCNKILMLNNCFLASIYSWYGFLSLWFVSMNVFPETQQCLTTLERYFTVGFCILDPDVVE